MANKRYNVIENESRKNRGSLGYDFINKMNVYYRNERLESVGVQMSPFPENRLSLYDIHRAGVIVMNTQREAFVRIIGDLKKIKKTKLKLEEKTGFTLTEL